MWRIMNWTPCMGDCEPSGRLFGVIRDYRMWKMRWKWMRRKGLATRVRALSRVGQGVIRRLLRRRILQLYQYRYPLHEATLGSIRNANPSLIINLNGSKLQLRIGLSMISRREINFVINFLRELFGGKSRRRPRRRD